MSLRAASGSELTSRPSKSNAPLDGVSTHPRMCISVDFPQPDGPQMATYSAGSISKRDAAHRGHRTSGHRKHFGDVASFDNHPITSAPQRRRNRQPRDGPHRIHGRHGHRHCEQRDVHDQRSRLEHEKAQVRRNPRHRLKKPIEPDRKREAQRKRDEPAAPTRSAERHRTSLTIRFCEKPSARSAAISPRRWLVDTESSTVMRRRPKNIVIVASTTEICRK